MCLAIPGQIDSIDDHAWLATVDVMGVRRQVNVALLQDEQLTPGDWVLVHVGFAMSKIGVEQAEDQLRLLAMLGEAPDAREEAEGYAFGRPEETTP